MRAPPAVARMRSNALGWHRAYVWKVYAYRITGFMWNPWSLDGQPWRFRFSPTRCDTEYGR